MGRYAILDYDGYICKAWYAAMANGDLDDAPEILERLVDSAIDKAMDYYFGELDGVIKVVSGHSWKKDLYTDYKATRSKNPLLGIFRDAVIECDKDIIKADDLEADEICIMLHDYLFNDGQECIVFSDDKDIHYTTLIHCKINLTEEIDFTYNPRYILYQMLAGDKEDNIKGIMKVGMKTAERLLKDKPTDIKEVIKVYKDKGLSKEECAKNLILIIPMSKEFNIRPHSISRAAIDILKNKTINNMAIRACKDGLVQYVLQQTEEVYNDNKTTTETEQHKVTD